MTSDADIQKLLDNDPDNLDNLPCLVERCLKEKGSVIPFVGAGLSRPFGFKLWGEFLEAAAANRPALLKKIQDQIKEGQYEEAASALLSVLTPRPFQMKFEKEFGYAVIANRTLTGAVAQLARFPGARVITTNFDRVLETCFRQHGVEVQSFPGSRAQYGIEALQQSKSFLLKLHGDWEDPENRVLTLEEYEKAYGHSAPESADLTLPLPHLLSLLMETRCLLFLGCSLAQDRTMRVLNGIGKQFPNRIYHFAIMERPAGATTEEANEATQKRKVELDALSIIPVWYPNGQHNLIENVLAYLADKMEAVFPPARPAVPNNIPDPSSETVGRQTEIDEIARKLQTDRLVTILGAGGCGKSRVALDVARKVKDSFPDGVWFIALADLAVKAGEENLLPARVGKAIGVPERPTHPPNESLLEYFGTGKHLLVLDNCEHLLAAVREFATSLLKGCAGLRILATSRAVVEAPPFERVYPLSPLAVPGAGETSLAAVLRSSSVQLFIERARRRLPRFDVDSTNAAAMAKIVEDLDGIPLAIEIVAARLISKSLQDISRETSHLLDERPGQDASNGTAHWASMGAAIGWSYNLLTPELQVFVRRQSVFDGGWTLEAATAVCGDESTRVPSEKFTADLLNNSLIVDYEVEGTRRFRLLEPIRQFLRQELTAAECESLPRAHAEWFRGVAENSAPRLLTGEMDATLKALQSDIDNYRAALRWAIEKHQAETGLRLMIGLRRFWEIRAYYTEGLARATEVLAIAGAEGFPALKCQVLCGAGILAYRMADFPRAERLFRQCMEIAEPLGDKAAMAEALSDLGLIAMMKGDFAESQELQRRCRDMERLNGNARGVAVATYNLGFVALGMGSADAVSLLKESLEQFESAGNVREKAFALNSLARCYVVSGDLDVAKREAQKSLDIRRELNDNKCVADSLRTLAWAAMEAGCRDDAVTYLKEGIGLARGVDDSRGVSEALELYALVAGREQHDERLVALAAAAEGIRGSYGYALPPSLIAERDGALEES